MNIKLNKLVLFTSILGIIKIRRHILSRLLRVELEKPETDSPKRIEVLLQIRNAEEQLLSVMRLQRDEMERQNQNMERAIEILDERRRQEIEALEQ